MLVFQWNWIKNNLLYIAGEFIVRNIGSSSNQTNQTVTIPAAVLSDDTSTLSNNSNQIVMIPTEVFSDDTSKLSNVSNEIVAIAADVSFDDPFKNIGIYW